MYDVSMFASRTDWDRRTNRLSQALEQHRASGKPIFDVTISNPTECGFQYNTSAVLQALCNPNLLQYHPQARGLKIARQAIAGYYAARGQQLAIEGIIVTVSTSEAYSFIFRLLCNPGDELLVPVPSYPLFDFLADVQDIKLVRYPLIYDHGWQIDFHALEQAITPRTRGVIAVHPNNPTGHYLKTNEIAQLNQLCGNRQMAIISDEVFLDFNLTNDRPCSLSGNSQALTFTLSGLSKISDLPQMKLAWLIASGPRQVQQEALARLEIIADTYLSASTPIQLATPALLEQRHGFQKQLMARVKANLAELDRQLGNQRQCQRLKVEGGWYAVLRVPATRSDEELAIELLERHGVYLHPGHFYDFPGDGHLVVSLITAEEIFSEAVQRILSAFEYSHPD